MNLALFRFGFLIVGLVNLTALRAGDAPAGFSRKILVERDLVTPGKHGTLAIATLDPGAATPRHTHPGEEFAYVLEGRVSFELDGQPARELHAGDAVIIPAGVAHLARNLGPVPARILSSYYLDKGKPLASPAPAK